MVHVARSISRRITRTVAAVTLFSLLLLMVIVWVAQEDMEDAILESDLQASRDLILRNLHQDEPLYWEAEVLVAFYQPHSHTDGSDNAELPALFQGRPFPWAGEVEIGEQTYLMTLGEVSGGRLYLAKDISAFEARVHYFHYVLLSAGLCVLLLALLLARLGSARLIRPLQALTEHIRGMRADREMARAPEDQEDLELQTIARSFNLFLDELEAFVRREQSLISLSSHELRTPAAVIGGALAVIEQRGRLGPEDQRTLARAQKAVHELRHTIDLILKLGRRDEIVTTDTLVGMPGLLREVVDDLGRSGVDVSRVVCEEDDACVVRADPGLVKMLVRNLIHNALRHTQGEVRVCLFDGGLMVSDQGAGLPDAYRILLQRHVPTQGQRASMSGLGLVIVTLICERLGWRIVAADSASIGAGVESEKERGTELQISWS